MSKLPQIRLSWRSALGAIALAAGTIGAIASPALAELEPKAESFQLVQILRRVNSPTPLNLRPRTHIPLPTRSRSSYHRYSDYDSRYRGAYGRHDRHDRYGYSHRDKDYRRDRRRRGSGGTVIIINPSNSSRHGSYIRLGK